MDRKSPEPGFRLIRFSFCSLSGSLGVLCCRALACGCFTPVKRDWLGKSSLKHQMGEV